MLRLIRLTPPGRAAIATVRVEGPGARAAVSAVFQSRAGRGLPPGAPNALAIGRIGQPQGEIVVVRCHAEDAVEIHCHGGVTAVARIEDALVAQGGRPATWQEWATGSRSDRVATAARLALAEARTERAALVLLDQLQGALRSEVQAIRAALDRGDAQAALERLDALLARAPVGLHLANPWRVVLSGLPNVGKSSLINAIVGYQRAIVHALPGTTRDMVAAETAIEGWPVQLCDTAGLRDSVHPVERAGVERARQTIAEADLLVLVGDCSRPWSPDEERLLVSRPEALVVHNKADLPHHPGQRPPGILTSVPTEQGLDQVLHAIAVRLVPDPPGPGTPVPCAADLVEVLRRARGQLLRGDPAAAASHLGEL